MRYIKRYLPNLRKRLQQFICKINQITAHEVFTYSRFVVWQFGVCKILLTPQYTTIKSFIKIGPTFFLSKSEKNFVFLPFYVISRSQLYKGKNLLNNLYNINVNIQRNNSECHLVKTEQNQRDRQTRIQMIS